MPISTVSETVEVTLSKLAAEALVSVLEQPFIEDWIKTGTYAYVAFYDIGGLLPALKLALEKDSTANA